LIVFPEKLPRDGAKRKATSIGVTHGQPTKQAVHRRHFGKELETNCEIQSKIEDEKEGRVSTFFIEYFGYNFEISSTCFLLVQA